ncbi:MAG: gamma-glutamylcyclotransferase family protein [Cyanobacteria bacterium P01_G01_bin.19]
MASSTNFIFGYGSLVSVGNLEQYLQRQLEPNADYTICSLKNWRRCWDVAMNNNIDLPQYKYYRDRQTKVRLDCCVTFLNIYPVPKQNILGILFQVFDNELKSLDLRERNYQRIDITKQLDLAVEGKAWTYVGLPAAKQRYQTGIEQNKAVISRDYIDLVQNAHKSLGSKEFADYLATTESPNIPIIDLEKYTP